jgi:hypothetical protein
VSHTTGMEPPAFEAFRQEVFADPALQAQLLPLDDPETFKAEVIALAQTRGHAVTEADVAAALREGQLSWLMSWVPVI